MRQYYIAEETLLAVDPATSDIIRFMQRAPLHMELATNCNHIVGEFLHFDAANRILHTESGTQLRLLPQHMEKSRLLKEKTKLWLAARTK